MTHRIVEHRAAVAARLRRFRGAMSDDEFARLVEDVIRTARRFDEIEAREQGIIPIAEALGFSGRKTRNPR
jgi:hypothetical protein